MLSIDTAMSIVNFASFWWNLSVELKNETGFKVMFIEDDDVSDSEIELMTVVELMTMRETNTVKFVVSDIAVAKDVDTTFSRSSEHDVNSNKFTKSDSVISWNSALSIFNNFVREYDDVKITELPEEMTHCLFEE